MDNPIIRGEHEEFVKRIEEEQRRQDKRIEILEKAVEQNNALTISVEKLAINMENMIKEQAMQGDRLEALEKRDGETWRTVKNYIITAVIGVIVGYIFTQIGM